MPAHLLIDYFEREADRNPDREFICFLASDRSGDASINYAQANARSSAYARLLLELGIGRGDVVAIVGANSINWVIAYLACQKIGAAANPVNPDVSAGDFQKLLAMTKPRAVITNIERFAEDTAELGCRIIWTDSDGDAICVDGVDRLLDAAPLERDTALSQGDTLSILFTSGTTGALPKAVVTPIGTLLNGIEGYRRLSNICSTDRVMVVTPLFHASALNWSVTLVILSGATLGLTSGFSASRFWPQALRGKMTVLWTLGAIPFILLRSPPDDDEAVALRDLRLIFAVGGGTRAAELRARWGRRFHDGWGMSETVGTMTDDGCFDNLGTYPCVGSPVPGMEMAILDPETGDELPPYQKGEIAVRFGLGFTGYYGNYDATSSAVRNGWFHSGDLGYRCEEGRYFFVDRIKDVIRRGGENIASSAVEQAVSSFPGVVEVYAVGKPDPDLSERVCLFLVPASDAAVPTLEAVREHCAALLPRRHLPEDLRLVTAEELPRTPSGRVQKIRLKSKLREEQAT